MGVVRGEVWVWLEVRCGYGVVSLPALLLAAILFSPGKVGLATMVGKTWLFSCRFPQGSHMTF